MQPRTAQSVTIGRAWSTGRAKPTVYHTSAVRRPAFSPDWRLCGLGGKVHVTMPGDYDNPRPILTFDTYANAIAYSPAVWHPARAGIEP
ncbi:MAG: hypothetical protein HRF45_09775 [Fimbriimonadia bacterium]